MKGITNDPICDILFRLIKINYSQWILRGRRALFRSHEYAGDVRTSNHIDPNASKLYRVKLRWLALINSTLHSCQVIFLFVFLPNNCSSACFYSLIILKNIYNYPSKKTMKIIKTVAALSNDLNVLLILLKC